MTNKQRFKLFRNITICSFAIIFFGIAGYACTSLTGKKSSFTIVENKKPIATIVIGKDAAESEEFAAEELRKYVKQISGAELKIRKLSSGESVKNAIVIGTEKTNPLTAQYAKDSEKLGPEAFSIRVADGNLLITGGGSTGALYGTYELLETLGCRWYFQDKDWQGKALSDPGEVVPKSSELSVDTAISIVERPSFKEREIWQGLGLDQLDWMAKHRCNYLEIPWWLWSEEAYAKSLKDIRRHGITIEVGHDNIINFWLPPDRYFKTHPEYYPLINGKRCIVPERGGKRGTISQFCFSNIDAAKEVAKNICKFLDRHPEIKNIGVSYSDARAWATMCQCDACKDLIAKHRPENSVSYSGAFLYFANNVAESVAEKHPEAIITVGAYEDPSGFEAPVNIKAAPNLRLIIYLFQRNGARAVDAKDSVRNSYISSELLKWKKIFDPQQIVIADYYYGMLTYKNCIWPIYKVIPQDFRYFSKNNFRGAALATGYRFTNQINNWLFGVYAWNANADIDALLDDFCSKFFEGASVPMRRYLELLAEMIRDYNPAKIQNIYQNPAGKCGKDDFLPVYPNLLAMLDEKRLQRLEDCLTEAKSMVPANGIVAKRIDHAAAELARSAAYVRISSRLKNINNALTENRIDEACAQLDKAIEMQMADGHDKNIFKEFQIPDLDVIRKIVKSTNSPAGNIVKNPSGLKIAQHGEAQSNANVTAIDRPEGWNIYRGDGSVKWGTCHNGENKGSSVFIEATAAPQRPDGKKVVNTALLPTESDGFSSNGAYSIKNDTSTRTYGLSFSAKTTKGTIANLFIFTWNSKGERQRMIDLQMLKPFTPGTTYSKFFVTFTLPQDAVSFAPAFHLSSPGRMDIRDISLLPSIPTVGFYAPDISSVTGFISVGNTIANSGSFKMTILPEDFETQLSKCQCLIIPQLHQKDLTALAKRKDSLRKYVKNGGNVFILRSACGYKPHGWPLDTTIFPEICEGVSGRAGRKEDDSGRILKVTAQHPVTSGLAIGETGQCSYWDHYVLIKGKSGEVAMADRDGLPLVIAGKLGKGKVVFAGFSPVDAATETELPEFKGLEKKVLINSLKWFNSK